MTNHHSAFGLVPEDKSFNEGLMLGKKTRTAIFSKEKGLNRGSTQNKETEDTSGKYTPQRSLIRTKTETRTKRRPKNWIWDEDIMKLLHAFYTP